MGGFNPFARHAEETPIPVRDKRSAWDRLDPDYRRLCERIARGGSPRNKRVRQLADSIIAAQRNGTK